MIENKINFAGTLHFCLLLGIRFYFLTLRIKLSSFLVLDLAEKCLKKGFFISMV